MDLAKSDEIDLIFTLDKKIYSSQWMCAAERVEDTIFVTSDRVFAQKSNIHLIQHLAKAAFLLTETGAAYRYELEQMLAEKEIEIGFGDRQYRNDYQSAKAGDGDIIFAGIYCERRNRKRCPFRDTDGFAGSEDVPSAFVSQEQMDDTTDESVSGSCACTARIS